MWRLEKYLKRQRRYKLVALFRAPTFAAALELAKDRRPVVVARVGGWRLYPGTATGRERAT